MLAHEKAFSGFAVDDIDAARRFYGETLGIEVEELPPHGLLSLKVGGGTDVLVYPKEDHEPAVYTILNFPVADVEAAVAELEARGVRFEHYEGTPMETDEKGVFRGGGPLIAWFTDPAGNVLSVIED
jgi:catechol 2,3-dioxygenase-like lactoylglutathione lyase family enzyme